MSIIIGWLILGVLGWAALMLYRYKKHGEGWFPSTVDLASYVRGFVGSLLLGPFCFLVLLVFTFSGYDD